MDGERVGERGGGDALQKWAWYIDPDGNDHPLLQTRQSPYDTHHETRDKNNIVPTFKCVFFSIGKAETERPTRDETEDWVWATMGGKGANTKGNRIFFK